MAANFNIMNKGDIDNEQVIQDMMIQIDQQSDGLQTILSSIDAEKRLRYASHLDAIIKHPGGAQPMRISKAVQMFQVCVHNVESLRPRSSSTKRKLFIYGQSALNELVEICLNRLQKTHDDIDKDGLEPPGMNHTQIGFETTQQIRSRFDTLLRVTKEIANMHAEEVRVSPRLQEAFHLLLGDWVRHHRQVGTSDCEDLEQLKGDEFNEEERTIWNAQMFDFAQATVFFMAKSMSSIFNNQSVDVLDTRIPRSAFW